jgi:hypothetical protein
MPQNCQEPVAMCAIVGHSRELCSLSASERRSVKSDNRLWKIGTLFMLGVCQNCSVEPVPGTKVRQDQVLIVIPKPGDFVRKVDQGDLGIDINRLAVIGFDARGTDCRTESLRLSYRSFLDFFWRKRDKSLIEPAFAFAVENMLVTEEAFYRENGMLPIIDMSLRSSKLRYGDDSALHADFLRYLATLTGSSVAKITST